MCAALERERKSSGDKSLSINRCLSPILSRNSPYMYALSRRRRGLSSSGKLARVCVSILYIAKDIIYTRLRLLSNCKSSGFMNRENSLHKLPKINLPKRQKIDIGFRKSLKALIKLDPIYPATEALEKQSLKLQPRQYKGENQWKFSREAEKKAR